MDGNLKGVDLRKRAMFLLEKPREFIFKNLHFRENVRDLYVFNSSSTKVRSTFDKFHLHWIINKPLMYCLLIPFIYIYLFCSMVLGPFVIGEAFL
jgi:hypothetical protein